MTSIQIELLLLLEIYLLKLEIKKEKLDYNSKCDFVIAVTDFSKRYDNIKDFVSMIRFISISDDKCFRDLCNGYTSYVLKFYRRIDKSLR